MSDKLMETPLPVWRTQTAAYKFKPGSKPLEPTSKLILMTMAESPEAFVDEAADIVAQFDERVVSEDGDKLRRHEFELIRHFLVWMYHGAPGPSQSAE